ncbi:MAG: helix-turn-helix domain-containing protein [Saprospiraceae bacterium]|nr:helix-turn-helix domain-containing protein [Saprospiraceae bacterium]
MENVVFTQLSISEFRKVMREELREELQTVLQEIPSIPKGKNVMDINAFCAYTGLSKQTVYRKTASGEIPHSKRGKRLYFDKKEIDEWLMANKVSPERMEDKTEQYFSNKRGQVPQKNRLP